MSMFGSKAEGKLPKGFQKTYKCRNGFCKGRARYKNTIDGYIYYKCPRCGEMFYSGRSESK